MTSHPLHGNALNELILGYVTALPQAAIDVKIGESSHIDMFFRIPSFTLQLTRPSSQHVSDPRTFSSQGRPLRQRYDFPSLRSLAAEIAASEEGIQGYFNDSFIYENTTSCLIIVPGHGSWTGYCLADDFYSTTKRMDEIYEDDEDDEDVGPYSDPFVWKPIIPGFEPDPHAYFIQSLENHMRWSVSDLKDIVDKLAQDLSLLNQEGILTSNTGQTNDIILRGARRRMILRQWLRKHQKNLTRLSSVVSQNRISLDEFLDEVLIGTDGFPRGSMFQGLSQDKLASRGMNEDVCIRKQLENIRGHRQVLIRLDRRLVDLSDVCKNLLLEAEHEDEDEKIASAAAKLEMENEIVHLTRSAISLGKIGVAYNTIQVMIGALSLGAALLTLSAEVPDVPLTSSVLSGLSVVAAGICVVVICFNTWSPKSSGK
ncbi:hypothetical protein B0I35DRAFT_135806 [Stachybotrys elegans]|uniref:Magnesium transporter n=1 Tax=Stachybotrys elegans TaxID=80388 RepID=A0A8K0SZ93_9HYPO|nr:hypothetical protein B0I35DRAFT_135806 [Stachybotrys elegans]